jgi:selenide, water dikinase
LGRIPEYPNPDVLVGYETADDAGVFRIREDLALVQTLDFFTPVVDDPFTFGAIAAANSLSDVYAMGGTPAVAMAIACFPEKGGDLDVLTAIMTGGAEKLHEAGVALIGGHTVADPEIKFGYSVTGLIHPGRILKNSSAQPGDALILTKPLGIGILTSGIKLGKTSPAAAARAIESMTRLNRDAAEIMLRFDTHAATDITGNGLLGHAYEMAEGSRVTLRFRAAAVPYIEEALALTEGGIRPRTIATTWNMISSRTWFSPDIPQALRNILLDPQTSGGLLISLSPADLPQAVDAMQASGTAAVYVGDVEPLGAFGLVVE